MYDNMSAQDFINLLINTVAGNQKPVVHPQPAPIAIPKSVEYHEEINSLFMQPFGEDFDEFEELYEIKTKIDGKWKTVDKTDLLSGDLGTGIYTAFASSPVMGTLVRQSGVHPRLVAVKDALVSNGSLISWKSGRSEASYGKVVDHETGEESTRVYPSVDFVKFRIR